MSHSSGADAGLQGGAPRDNQAVSHGMCPRVQCVPPSIRALQGQQCL